MQNMQVGQQTCCCSYPNCPICRPRAWPQPQTVYHYNWPSAAEQMGNDPQSKLAAAINRLCDLIEGSQAEAE
jgi:hypothetical protein